ncbi:hypothetical protein LC612_41610, partial [Nostoc sp. CHAB 5834]|nr:hypothetical protein [Nostoc sp. CHAB 5834]
RERALAKAWEALNSDAGGWLTPVFENLVPKYTSEQAHAAATVVQWLGSEVGFQFLSDTLKKAGYEIVDKAPASH